MFHLDVQYGPWVLNDHKRHTDLGSLWFYERMAHGLSRRSGRANPFAARRVSSVPLSRLFARQVGPG